MKLMRVLPSAHPHTRIGLVPYLTDTPSSGDALPTVLFRAFDRIKSIIHPSDPISTSVFMYLSSDGTLCTLAHPDRTVQRNFSFPPMEGRWKVEIKKEPVKNP